jgi:tetratricopeptide (TPR) repeat protein
MSALKLSTLLRKSFLRSAPQNASKRMASTLSSPRASMLRRADVPPPPHVKDPSFTTSPYNEAMGNIKSQAKMVAKITGYTVISVSTAVAFVWQLSHWYIEYMMSPTPPELGYQARNLLHGAYIRETIAPNFEVASFYVREALRIALEEKNLEESSTTVIQLRLRLAHDEAHAGNLLDAITEYTRSWKLLIEKGDKTNKAIEAAKHIGDLYLRIADYEHAEEFLAWALHNTKDDGILKSKITLTLASLYALQRNFQLALPLLSETLKAVPETNVCLKAIVQNQLSEIMYGLGKVDEAMGWAQAAINASALDLKNQDCLECGGVASNNLGKMLELKGEFDQALDYYNQAVTYSLSVHDSESRDRYILNQERVQELLKNKAQ